MSRNDFFEDFNIVDDNPDLHAEDSFFLKSPPPIKYDGEDEVMEQQGVDDVEKESVTDSFPAEVNSEEILENMVRLYSLSYSVDESDLVSMLQDDVPDLTPDHIMLIRYPDGKLTGTAFIHLSGKEHVIAALKYNGRMLRGRLLMIMPSTAREMEECQDKAEKGMQIRLNPIKSGHGKLLIELRTPCVHIKGICLTSNHNAIRRFFEPIRIPPQSVFLITRMSGSSSLEAYVQFRDVEDSEKALSKHNELMDENTVEVYPVSKSKMLEAIDMHGVLDKGPVRVERDYVGSDVLDARIRARQAILKERERHRSRSPPYSPNRASYLSRDRESDSLSRLRDIDLLRDRGRFNERVRGRDRYQERDSRYDSDDRLPSLGYNSKNDRVSDSVRSSRLDRYPRDDMRDRLDEYRSSPPNRRTSRRSPYSDRVPSRSREVGRYSSELTRNPVVKMSGLPSSTIIYDLIDYFQGFDLKIDSVRIQCNDDGSPNGKAFIRFPSFSQAMLAIDQCKGKGLGNSRSIELSLI